MLKTKLPKTSAKKTKQPTRKVRKAVVSKRKFTTTLATRDDNIPTGSGRQSPRDNYQYNNHAAQRKDKYVPNGNKNNAAKNNKNVPVPCEATRTVHPLASRHNPAYATITGLVRDGKGRELAQFLSDPANVSQVPFDSQDWFGSTLLCSAVKKHYFNVLMKLLPFCDVNATSKNGPPLFHAIAVLDLSITRTLVENGADVNHRDPKSGQTALMIAASLSNPAFVLYLIENGAQLDIQDTNGRTALMYAAKRGIPHIVSCLYDRGANISLQDNHGNDAFFYATQRDDDRLAEVQQILTNPPNTKLRAAPPDYTPAPAIKRITGAADPNFALAPWLANVNRETLDNAMTTAAKQVMPKFDALFKGVEQPIENFTNALNDNMAQQYEIIKGQLSGTTADDEKSKKLLKTEMCCAAMNMLKQHNPKLEERLNTVVIAFGRAVAEDAYKVLFPDSTPTQRY